MDIERAFFDRESLSERDLDRLRLGVLDQVQRYEHQIRNYPPDRMDKFGRPYLDRLTAKLTAVDELIARRRNGS